MKWTCTLCSMIWVLSLCDLGAVSINYPPKITVSINKTASVEGSPIRGVLTIIRLQSQTVDEKSFLLGEDFLKTELVSNKTPNPGGIFDVKDPDALVVSTYEFYLPSQRSGLYTLPVISVKVGDYQIFSSSITYEITSSSNKPKLFLEALVKEHPPFYLGQKIHFVYKIHFTDPIDMTLEELPLLSPVGFRNLGAPKIQTEVVGSETIQTIEQESIALSVGIFNLGESLVEGMAYKLLSDGKKEYFNPKLSSRAASIEVTVSEFPTQNRPLSFNGALGIFHCSIELKSDPEIVLGDKFSVELTISGDGDWDSVTVPDLSKQPGFKSIFKWDEWSVSEERVPGAKKLTFQLRPLIASIKEIPSIEFSSFDLVHATFCISRTHAISVQIEQQKPSFPSHDSFKVSQKERQIEGDAHADPIEIQGNFVLNRDDIARTPFAFLDLMETTLASIILYSIQRLWIRRMFSVKVLPQENSEFLLTKAHQVEDMDDQYALLYRAILLKLVEVHVIDPSIDSPVKLAKKGLQGRARLLLEEIDRARFGGNLLKEQQKIGEKVSNFFLEVSDQNDLKKR